MHVDFIIVGQGLAGSLLSWNLLRQGKSVLVIDEDQPYSASKVASGVINPVTGRRMVRTWMIETLMPYAVSAYQKFGSELGVTLIQRHDIVDFHPTPQMKLAFQERVPEEKEYLRLPMDEREWAEHFNYVFGFGSIQPCWLVNISAMLQHWRIALADRHALLPEVFRLEEASITPEKITYQDVTADKILFCDGVAGFDNPYFHLLPYAKNKGQALIVEIPGLPRTNIYKQGMTIVPWHDDLFWVGSSYEWNFTDTAPDALFREKAAAHLDHWLAHPYKVLDHIASERPANMERRPFVGLHPGTPSVGILNGMGTKGCSLAPYFADQLTAFLLHDTPITPAADVKRFERILKR